MPASVDWDWTWGPASGIANQYEFGDNLPWDIVRVAMVIMSMILLFGCLRVIAEQRRRQLQMPRTQEARFVALILASIYVGGTESWVMGTPATPRVVVGAVMLLLGLYGVLGVRRKQMKQPIVGF